MSVDRPEPLAFHEEPIPDTLRNRDNWVTWKYKYKPERDEYTKILLDVNTGGFGDSTDPDTWVSFEKAVEYHNDPATDTDGVGFVLSESDTVVGLDLDDCRDPDSGDLEPWARDVLEDVPTYAEVSPSGTGLRLMGLGFVPSGGNRGDIDDAAGHLEIYDSGRYLTLTGHHLEDTPSTVEQVNSEVEAIHTQHIADPPETTADGGVDTDTGGSNPGGNTSGSASLTDTDLIQKAKSAENGDRFTQLWNGRTAGYPSHSEAQLAFANHLAYWTQRDERRMLKLFEKSDMCRGDDDIRKFENYDAPKAVGDVKNTYDPASSAPPSPPRPDVPVEGDSHTVRLEPDAVKARAGLSNEDGEDGSISDLNDREKAACVWELIHVSDRVHVRVRREDGQLWAYDNGVWKPEGKRALRHAGRRAVGSMNFGTNVVNQLEAQARGDPRGEVEVDELGLSPGQLAVENGLIDLKDAANGHGDDARRDLEPEDYALKQLPVAYDPDAEYDDWAQLVDEWAEDGRADALQEYVGYCLHRGDMPIHRALMLVGSGANGKSTFLHVVRELLGCDNTTSFELQTLADDENYRDRFFGSVANIDEDLSARQLESSLGMLKKLFAGDPIEAARKYNDPYDYEPTGKHLYAANEVPSINVSDDDEAFWRRWLLVEFPNHYPAGERDPGLRDRLTTDEALSGVLNWAIEGWDRLLEQGHFTNEEREAYAKRQRWQSWGEAIDKFLNDCVERDEDADRISTGDAFGRFQVWCRENGLKSDISPQGFTNKLKSEDVGYKKSVRIDGSSKRGYTALGFSDDVPEARDDGEREEPDPDATSLGSFDDDTDEDAREGDDGDGEREAEAEAEPTDDTDDDTPAVDEATGLRDRVRDFLEDKKYRPGASVTVAAVAGGMEANPIPVEKALDELADSDAPLSHATDGEYMIEVSD